jgi:hypothetical protein
MPSLHSLDKLFKGITVRPRTNSHVRELPMDEQLQHLVDRGCACIDLSPEALRVVFPEKGLGHADA